MTARRALPPAALVALALLAACEPGDMTRQGKVMPFEAEGPIPGTLLPPPGTVPQPQRPPPPEPAPEMQLARGAERYAIFCEPCHGADGDGRSRIPTLVPPDSFHEGRLAGEPAEHFFQVMSEGRGRMYPFAGRIPPNDRRAIALWIKQLQAERR